MEGRLAVGVLQVESGPGGTVVPVVVCSGDGVDAAGDIHEVWPDGSREVGGDVAWAVARGAEGLDVGLRGASRRNGDAAAAARRAARETVVAALGIDYCRRAGVESVARDPDAAAGTAAARGVRPPAVAVDADAAVDPDGAGGVEAEERTAVAAVSPAGAAGRTGPGGCLGETVGGAAHLRLGGVHKAAEAAVGGAAAAVRGADAVVERGIVGTPAVVRAGHGTPRADFKGADAEDGRHAGFVVGVDV